MVDSGDLCTWVEVLTAGIFQIVATAIIVLVAWYTFRESQKNSWSVSKLNVRISENADNEEQIAKIKAIWAEISVAASILHQLSFGRATKDDMVDLVAIDGALRDPFPAMGLNLMDPLLRWRARYGALRASPEIDQDTLYWLVSNAAEVIAISKAKFGQLKDRRQQLDKIIKKTERELDMEILLRVQDPDEDKMRG